MADKSPVRRAYDLVALFALLNVVAVVAVGGYLVGTGVLTVETVQRVAAAIREDGASADETSPDAVTDETGRQDGEVASAATPGGYSASEEESMRREAQRIKAELDQRIDLMKMIRLQWVAQKEAFEQQRAQIDERAAEVARAQEDEGFKKELAYFQSLSPKVAVEHLLALPDPDDAARVLLEIPTRKGKKIIEAAKRGDQMQKMKAILQRLRNVAPERSNELEDK